MYCKHWNLTEPPFENLPDPRFVFFSNNHDEALMRLVYTVTGRKGACMLTGEVGCGKTTISSVLKERLRDRNHQIAMVTNPNLSTVDLLREILTLLGGPSTPGSGKLELLHALRAKFLDNLAREKDTIIIIDEAHLIKREETYEELRLLLNHHLDNRFLVTLILSGQPELKNHIDAIPQFSQRIPIRYHLTPLSFVDTCKYIHTRLTRAGNHYRIFTSEAAKLIYDRSQGIPRRINSICDMSLLAGFVEKSRQVDRPLIAKVIQGECQ